MKKLSDYEVKVLNRLCVDGIKKLKEVIKLSIDLADCPKGWDIVELNIIETIEAQCIVDKLSQINSSKNTGNTTK